MILILFIGNSHFENCQVKVKAEVKENTWNFPYFSPQPRFTFFPLNLNLNLNLVKFIILWYNEDVMME
jgi:hypothetical protein